MFRKFSKNLIILFLVAVVLFGTGTFVFLRQGKIRELPEETLSAQEVAEKTIEFITQNLLEEGMTASLVSVEEESGLYKIRLKIGGQEFGSYVTKDGKILFPQEGINLEQELPEPESEKESSPEEITKSERPDVKLFVMSYCPYGLQATKMFLPVYDLLKEKAEMGIYFVDYAMHGKQELDENLRQYCIQRDQRDKLSEYLSCFVLDGDFEKCLSEAGIDKDTLTSCITETDQQYGITDKYNDENTWLNGRYPRFDVHTDLNEGYGVRGSPTIVINGQQVSVSPRSPEQFKNTICQAFNSAPQECSRSLSQDVPSPGLGEGVGSSSGGSCE